MNQTFVFLDLETTGLNPDTDDIIEIGAVKAKEGEITERFTTLVATTRTLPPRIVSLTGINHRMLEGAPSLADASGELLSFIGDLPMVGHHVNFDLGFLTAKTGFSLPNPVIDTLDFIQIALPQASSYRLETVRAVLGFPEGQSHRALADAETACRIFFRCLDILKGLDYGVLRQIYGMVSHREDLFTRILRQQTEEAVKKFPAAPTGQPYAFNRTPQSADNGLFADSKTRQSPEIELTQLEDLLGPAGPFSRKFPQYRHRPGQVEMLATVVRGLREQKHMIIEAGTGTGKSLAYLIPAAAWAVTENKKMVISTHTINLQEQLWSKDLPAIREVTGMNFTAALVKGRTNYLCLRRWEARLKDSDTMDHNELVFYLKTLVWLTKTESGDKSELNVIPSQYLFWSDISSDQDACLGSSCPRFHRQCFISKARRQAEAADLLIVNHSLLLADLKLQNRLLPAHEYLIIDEAHHLEDSATEQLGWTIAAGNLRQMLFSLVRGFHTGLSPGLLHQLKMALRNYPELFSQTDMEKADRLINDAFEKVGEIQKAHADIEQVLKSWAWSQTKDGEGEASLAVRVKNEHRTGDGWTALTASVDNYIGRNVSLAQSLRKIHVLLDSVNSEQENTCTPLLKDIEFFLNVLKEIISNLQMFLEGDDDYVFWIEIDNGPRSETKIRCAPVSVSNLLYVNLFSTKRSTLMTSATVSVDGDFDHFMGRTGLSLFPREQIICKILPSPFCYEKQAILCIPRDIPEPGAVSADEFIEAITPLIGDIVTIFGGRTLVLFTSHRMLKDVYCGLQTRLEPLGITLLGHKIDGSRARLTEDFRKNEKTVLLGANSFWEGIDLAGEVLKCVILVRLPFSPPNTPVVEARIEEVMKNNKDAFYGYSVPDAVLRFKQGFGRLIRSEGDEGVIVVLDRRIVDKRYGRKFLNSLPIKTHIRGDTATILQKISDWAKGERPREACLNVLANSVDLEKYLGRTGRKNGRRRDSTDPF